MTSTRRGLRDPWVILRHRQGAAIRAARRRRGLTVDEVARTVGVTPGALRHWEAGRWSPRPRHQAALAAALDLRWGDLFDVDQTG